MANDNNLGPWQGANLSSTAQQSTGAGIDAGTPTIGRFVSGVVTLLRRRIQVNAGEDGKQAVFLLEPRLHIHDPDANNGCVPTLDKGLTPVSGKLWFVNAAVIRGNFVDFQDCDDSTLYSIITDRLNLGHVPAIVFDPRGTSPDVRFYPNGLTDSEVYNSLPLYTVDVSMDKIFEAIEHIYKESLITPEAQSTVNKLWKDSHPISQAEETIQAILIPALQIAFNPCKIHFEDTSRAGRLDISIVELDPTRLGHSINHAVLELKVLRTKGETGRKYTDQYNLDWVKSGVDQALAYRVELNARECALCCFDMRETDSGETCFDHVKQTAVTNAVHLKRWYLYSTSKNFRATGTAAA